MNRVDMQERTQRIRYGLTGLAVVFLFVLLGTAISNSADDASGVPAQTVNEAAEPNEPLAEIGAAPGATAASNETSGQEPAKSPDGQ
jgi:hypothetical protein